MIILYPPLGAPGAHEFGVDIGSCLPRRPTSRGCVAHRVAQSDRAPCALRIGLLRLARGVLAILRKPKEHRMSMSRVRRFGILILGAAIAANALGLVE